MGETRTQDQTYHPMRSVAFTLFQHNEVVLWGSHGTWPPLVTIVMMAAAGWTLALGAMKKPWLMGSLEANKKSPASIKVKKCSLCFIHPSLGSSSWVQEVLFLKLPLPTHFF